MPRVTISVMRAETVLKTAAEAQSSSWQPSCGLQTNPLGQRGGFDPTPVTQYFCVMVQSMLLPPVH